MSGLACLLKGNICSPFLNSSVLELNSLGEVGFVSIWSVVRANTVAVSNWVLAFELERQVGACENNCCGNQQHEDDDDVHNKFLECSLMFSEMSVLPDDVRWCIVFVQF